MEKKYSPDTLALHAGYDCSANAQSRAVPIYATTSYVFKDFADGADLFALKKPGFIYSRLANPTVSVLEDRLAAYHGAAGALASSSGSSANFLTLLTLAGPGKKIISSPYLYGGTQTLLEHGLKRFGIQTIFVDLNDEKALRGAVDDSVACIFGEAVANPGGQIMDMEKVAAVAHEYGLPLVVDNSVAPPPLLNPFEYGADLVCYSLTKLIGGHGTHLGGVALEKGTFDWGATGRYTDYLNAPDPSYNGLNFWEKFGKPNLAAGQGVTVMAKMRLDLMRNLGPVLSPFGAHEFLLGLETLPLRARRQAQSAWEVATFLAAHPKVAQVEYSGLPDSPHYQLAQKYLAGQPGAVFGVRLKGGFDDAVRFINHLDLWSHLANILDARSLIIHPASTTHQQLSAEERRVAGVPDDFVRLSVGLEDSQDLIAALERGLAAV